MPRFEFLVVPRPGYDVKRTDARLLEFPKMNPSLEVDLVSSASRGPRGKHLHA